MILIATRPEPVGTVHDHRLLRRPVAGARVLVITGSYGAGHDSAAREIALRFAEAGATTEVQDIVDLLPMRLGRLLRAAYLSQIQRAPETWETTLRGLRPGSRLHRWTTGALRACGRKVRAAAADADLVISTHPFASQVLGGLRDRGELAAPVATYLTDASVHSLWVARGVDLHVAIHGVAAADARSLGGRTVLVRPLVPTAPVTSRSRAELGLPEQRTLGVVVGGSLGIGDLAGTAEELLACGVTPVVMCGENEGLRRDLSTRPGVIAMGWRDDVRDVFSVADLVVQNSGGFMTLEAMSVGVPLLSYGVLPGHGRTNAAALEEAGLAPWVRSADDLGPTLRRLLGRHAPMLPDQAPDIVDLLAGPVAPATLAIAPPHLALAGAS